jgi:hypothetical protein
MKVIGEFASWFVPDRSVPRAHSDINSLAARWRRTKSLGLEHVGVVLEARQGLSRAVCAVLADSVL